MRKRSKCAFLATAMAATTILAAGCGNSASGGQNTADSAERVPIRWLTTGDAAAEAIQDNDRIIEAINEKLGIDLTVEIGQRCDGVRRFPGCGNWCIRDERNPAVD